MRTLALADAIRKMTLMPAEGLRDIAPAMQRKGRIQVGANADVTIFDREEIIDTATFQEDLPFSKDIEQVIVLGTSVVRNAETVDGAFPPQPTLGDMPRANEARALALRSRWSISWRLGGTI